MILVVASSMAAACAATFAVSVARLRRDRPVLPEPLHPASPRTRLLPFRQLVAGSLALMCLVGPAPLPVLAPVIGLVAWRGPVFVAGRRARRRIARADAELPQLLDLLAAASSAGLSASLSLRRAWKS